MRLLDLVPTFAEELGRLLMQAGRPELAAQASGLPVVARCRCGEANCGTSYNVPPPNGPWGPKHQSILLPSTDGLVVVDVLEDRIVCVEVLDRPDVSDALTRWERHDEPHSRAHGGRPD